MKHPDSRRSPLGIAATLAMCVVASRAAATSDSVAARGVARLESLLESARRENPEIKAAEARYRAMQQRPVQEGTLPDPTVGVRFHNEDFSRITFGESEFSFLEFSAEQEVPFPGKLGLRASVATRAAERERAMRDMTVLMVLARVTTAYADLAVIDRSAGLVHEAMRSLDLVTKQAAQSYAVGVAAQQDVLRASLERGGLDERLTMLVQKRAGAEAGLVALLGRPAEEPLGATEWSDDVPAVAPLSELETRLTASPALRAADEEVQRSEKTLDLARREYLPDFAFMGAYTNKDGLLPEWELGMRLRLPLYFWRRQRAAVAEATFGQTEAEQTRRTTRLGLTARLRELYAMADAAFRLVQLYRDRLVPQADLTFKSAGASYAVGKVDFLTMLNAFTALLEYRMRLAEELGNLRRARAEIAPLIGETPLGERLP